MLLSAHERHIGCLIFLPFLSDLRNVWRNDTFFTQMFDEGKQIRYRNNVYAACQRCLLGIFSWHIKFSKALFFGKKSDWEHSLYSSYYAIESQFTDKEFSFVIK